MKAYKSVIAEVVKTSSMLILKFFVPDLPRINNINKDFCFVVGYVYLEQYRNFLDFDVSIGTECIVEIENYKDFKVIFNASL